VAWLGFFSWNSSGAIQNSEPPVSTAAASPRDRLLVMVRPVALRI
jgi:hypothetical protein